MRTAFEAEGEIRSMDLLAGIVTFWREAQSGSLHFLRPGASAGFQLVAGEIVGVSSSDPRFETASILFRAGKLDAATLERLATPEEGDRAQAAMQAGILTKREWRWGEKIRAVEVLSDLLTWLEGDYLFETTPPPEAGEFRLAIPRLVLELFLRSRDRGLVLHYLGGADVPLARSHDFDAEFATFGLTADAESVVRLIDGKATAAEIASEAPAESFAVEKLLAALVTLGLIHPEFAAGERRPQAVPAGQTAPSVLVEPPTDEGSGKEEGEEEPESAEEEEGGEQEEPSEALEESVELPEESVAEGTPSLPETFESYADAGEAPLRSREHAAQPPSLADFGPGEPLGGGLVGGTPEEIAEREVFEMPIGVSGEQNEDRPARRSSAAFLWLLGFLVAVVAAIILLRGRGAPIPRTLVPLRGGPTAAPSGTGVSAAPSPEPTAPPQTPGVTAISARVRPTPASPALAPTRASAPLPIGPTASAVRETEREGSRAYWLDRASRDRKRAGADRKAHFTIQLELACEVGSLIDAWKHDRPAGTMWLLATPFQGRTCFRVLWGRYPNRDAARRALSSVPAFFATPRNRPIVTAIH